MVQFTHNFSVTLSFIMKCNTSAAIAIFTFPILCLDYSKEIIQSSFDLLPGIVVPYAPSQCLTCRDPGNYWTGRY